MRYSFVKFTSWPKVREGEYHEVWDAYGRETGIGGQVGG